MKLQNWKKIAYDMFFIVIGSLIFSIGINNFALTNGLAEGGFTGLAIFLYYVFGFSPGIVILLLNIPLLFIGYKVLGKRTFIYTIIGIAMVSVNLEVTKNFSDLGKLSDDLLLAALYTGVCVGAGLGLIFRVGATTGGVDIIARLMNKYHDWSIGKTMFLFDSCVIAINAFEIGREKTMYTMVAVFIGSRVVDLVIEGMSSSKAVTIISNSAVAISNKITVEMDRGITLLKGRGGYTGMDKEVLYVVVSRNELPRLKQLINGVDAQAFVVVHDVKDVLGEGFSFERT
ncbi:YitT family protein [Mechercharimyces sp. CAU 1602]|uniref:YitT family protein n=1 Tax=Mechercharimyces sp. CAU 1602 TaxID=2973933 RepID=UPI00216161DF|nr:YitT family protein [Mechercharimyces sp. CAU 1602]MCS1351007.1 YitT family protein [Mechercharimyces sp. CAU 1602]